MKKFTQITLILGVLFLVGCTKGCLLNRSGQLSERVVVKVNEVDLTAEEFANALADQLKNYDALTVKEEGLIIQAKQQVVRDFIIRVITESWAQENGLLVQKEELEAELANIKSQYPDDLTFRQKLIEQNISYETWRSQIKLRKLQHKVVEQLKSKISQPSESEMKEFFKEHKKEYSHDKQVLLEQIVVRTEDEADRIRQGLRKGKKFGELAKQFSITPESENGGRLGWIEQGMSDTFDSAFQLPVNRLSGVLKSPYGYHILKVVKKRKAFTESFEDVKERIYKQLIQNREQAAYSKWLEKQIRKAKVLKDEFFIASMRVETSAE
ncbi:MAG: peptidylprolyl isomerase [Bdellovibrionales bacterium]|nr:peptidylprolyl isomerase [Bdellovibrionales bacterium]